MEYAVVPSGKYSAQSHPFCASGFPRCFRATANIGVDPPSRISLKTTELSRNDPPAGNRPSTRLEAALEFSVTRTAGLWALEPLSDPTTTESACGNNVYCGYGSSSVRKANTSWSELNAPGTIMLGGGSP